MVNNAIVVNLFGGPGSGKSTLSSGIFYELKKRGIVCELVQEYAKSRVWENATDTLDDQLYIFAKQNHAQRRVANKVDVVITDSPILLSSVYNKCYSERFVKLVHDVFNEYNNINYFINRCDDYQTTGRIQSKEDAEDIDRKILDVLRYYDFRRIDRGEVFTVVVKVLRMLDYEDLEV